MMDNKMSANLDNLFWNREKNRFEIDASEMEKIAFCEPNIFGEIIIFNEKTGNKRTFQRNRKLDLNFEGELVAEVYVCREDKNLQLHIIND